MERERFARWVRLQTTARSRRRAVTGVLSGALGLVGFATTEAAHLQARSSMSRRVAHQAVPDACSKHADLTDCGGGRQCSGGVCAARACGGNGAICLGDRDCCSGACYADGCDLSLPGEPCDTSTDCLAGAICVGFICQ
jgi:hypothetical protein